MKSVPPTQMRNESSEIVLPELVHSLYKQGIARLNRGKARLETARSEVCLADVDTQRNFVMSKLKGRLSSSPLSYALRI